MSGETEASVSGWTVDTLHAHVTRLMSDMLAMLNERYATQTKALDAAFLAAEKAVQAALASAQEAVGKAETATEKRFASVNEFRAQLTDQAATFVTRNEADTRLGALADKFETASSRNSETISEVELRLTSRLDQMSGHAEGSESRHADNRLTVGTLMQVLTVIISVAAVVIVIAQHK